MYNIWDTCAGGGGGGLAEQAPRMMHPHHPVHHHHHSMMQLCRDFPSAAAAAAFKSAAAAGLPGAHMYGGHHQFEGILELRKEKSRDAARSRRGKENYEFYELAKMLPLPGAITSQLDKASIVRLTIANLKLKDFSSHGDPPWQREGQAANKNVKGSNNRRRSIANYANEVFDTHQGTHILQSLDGFGFNLSNDGRFLYISETVSIYLGLSQVEMTGSSIFDYIHPDDQNELATHLGLGSSHHYPSSTPPTSARSTSPLGHVINSAGGEDDEASSSSTPRATSPITPERSTIMTPNPSEGLDRSFCIRMKSTLTKRGVHSKSAGYRVVHVMGHLRPQYSFSLARKQTPPILGLVAIAIALPAPTVTELLIDSDMFVSRLSPEFKVTYVEPRVSDLMDMGAEDLTNQNLYNYCHAQDLQILKKAHVDLLSKGQVMTDYYRLMNKHGGFIWIQTCATVLFNAKNQDEQNIIAINYVLSGIEYPGCIMDMRQLRTVTNSSVDPSDHSENEHELVKSESSALAPLQYGTQLGSTTSNVSLGQISHTHSNMTTHSKETASDIITNNPADIGTSVSQSVNQLLDFPPISPTQPDLGSIFCNTNGRIDNHEEVDTNMNNLYNDEDDDLSTGDKNCKVDNKNSRRKMDKPRKRKRDSLDVDNEAGVILPSKSKSTCLHATSDTINANTNTAKTNDTTLNAPMTSQSPLRPVTVGSQSVSSMRSESVQSNLTSPSPNHSVTTPKTNSTPNPEDLTVQVTSPNTCVTSPGQQTTLTSQSSVNTPLMTMTSNCGTDIWSSTGETPGIMPATSLFGSDISVTNTSSVRDLEEVMNKHLPLTAQMDAELRHEYAQSFLGGLGKNKSAIQWVGSNCAGGEMTASNLLRSLYASRETVIRSNVYNPRPQYYSDMQPSLLTPPGATNDPYKESFQANIAQSKSQAAPYSGLTYPANSLPVSMATGLGDGFTMTPPSSVSPHEKYQTPFCESMPYGTDTMPLKPQGYPISAQASYERTMTNQYAPYYGNGTASLSPYGHTVHYREPTKNGVW